MPQIPRIPRYLLILNPLIIFTRQLRNGIHQALSLKEHWILALIVHHELAWLLCAASISIGEATKAPWRFKVEAYGDQTNPRTSLSVLMAVFMQWSRYLGFTICVEIVGYLIGAVVCFMAMRSGRTPPQLLPLIERAWLAVGFDLMSVWRTHYR
jgi:hypothetical protein